MDTDRRELLANLQYVAQFHLCKAATAIARDDFILKPAHLQVALHEALQDTGAFLGFFSRNLLGTQGAEPLDVYLPRLLDQLDVLKEACRAVGAGFNDYDGFRTQLLAPAEVAK